MCVAPGTQIFGRIYDDACVLRLITCTHYFEQQILYNSFDLTSTNSLRRPPTLELRYLVLDEPRQGCIRPSPVI